MSLKKCIVLDLDNTLWGGIVGEDGLKGIKLALNGAGADFIAFQQALLNLYNRGVILAVNSRNNYEDAIKVIREHPNMILKEPHFAALRINWSDKVMNLIELAKELNIGLDSMVFLDDDPTNRATVRAMLSEVEVPELPPNSADYAKFLINLPYFPVEALTDEDKMRGNMYVTERLRLEAEKSFDNREEFLKNLGLELQIFVDDSNATARLAQLTEKTNQFNINKNPLSEEEITKLIKQDDYKVIHGRLTDRFGDHGIINLIIIKKQDDVWYLEQLLMSCRVIGRGVEDALLSVIGQMAKSNQVKKLNINFRQTEKNKPAEDFVNKHFKNNLILVDEIAVLPSWITVKYGKV
jgi:FkbH-like protein